jgi:hypothetical protein
MVFPKELVDVLGKFDNEPGHGSEQEETTHRHDELTHSLPATLHTE